MLSVAVYGIKFTLFLVYTCFLNIPYIFLHAMSLLQEWAMKYWVSLGAPKEKLNMGIASYGRTFTLKNQYNNDLFALAIGPGEKTTFVQKPGMISYYEVNLILISATLLDRNLTNFMNFRYKNIIMMMIMMIMMIIMMRMMMIMMMEMVMMTGMVMMMMILVMMVMVMMVMVMRRMTMMRMRRRRMMMTVMMMMIMMVVMMTMMMMIMMIMMMMLHTSCY
jgi:hypothetical protein